MAEGTKKVEEPNPLIVPITSEKKAISVSAKSWNCIAKTLPSDDIEWDSNFQMNEYFEESKG